MTAATQHRFKVLQEAYSSRYKNAFHSGAFQNAVKTYRQRRKHRGTLTASSNPVPNSHVQDANASTVQESNERAQKHLEELPAHILRQCRTFYRHVQYFMHVGNGNNVQYQEGAGSTEMSMPVDLRVMLDEIARSHNLGDKVKSEIMQDEESRNVRFPFFLLKILFQLSAGSGSVHAQFRKCVVYFLQCSYLF